jgi:NAD(P)H-hydrate epimerase
VITVPIQVPVVPAAQVPAVTARVMAEIDRRAVDDFGITLLQMMEQAGSHLAALISAQLGGDPHDRRIVVAVGPGNNGGGGLVAARHLTNRGASVRVILARPVLRMAPAARDQLATLMAMGADCCVATYDLADPALEETLATADIVVDAIMGYRIDGPPHGEVDRLIGFVARAGRPVVSLDLPSGVHPDTGEVAGQAVTAAATLALALPKPALLGPPGARRTGRLYLADIGLPAALYAGMGIEVGSIFAAGRIIELERP